MFKNRGFHAVIIDEIKRAILEIINDYGNNKLTKMDITEGTLTNYPDTKNYRDSDF